MAGVRLAEGASEAELLLAFQPGVSARERADLIEAGAASARALGASSLLIYVPSGDADALRSLAALGAGTVSGYRRWRSDLAATPAPQPLPPGFELVPCVGAGSGDLALAATEAAWGDLPGHQPATPASVAEALEAYGPEGQFVLVGAGGAAAGMVRMLLTAPGEGYVDAPGLAPSLRSATNYAALARFAVDRLIGWGARSAVMESWGDPPAARRAWEAMGWQLEELVEARRLRL